MPRKAITDRTPGRSAAGFRSGGVRVGGAPVADLEALRCERAWAVAEEDRPFLVAVAKPSPFTLSGLGEWSGGSPAVEPSGDLDWCGVVELDRSAVLDPLDHLARRVDAHAAGSPWPEYVFELSATDPHG